MSLGTFEELLTNMVQFGCGGGAVWGTFLFVLITEHSWLSVNSHLHHQESLRLIQSIPHNVAALFCLSDLCALMITFVYI